MRVIWAEQAAFPCIAAAPPTTSLGSETNSLTASPDLSASVSEKRSTSDNDKWSIGSDKKTDDEATLGRSQSNSFVLASEVESAIHSPTSRPLRMFAPVYSGLAAALSLCKSSHRSWFPELTELLFSFPRQRYQFDDSGDRSRRKLSASRFASNSSIPALRLNCASGSLTTVHPHHTDTVATVLFVTDHRQPFDAVSL